MTFPESFNLLLSHLDALYPVSKIYFAGFAGSSAAIAVAIAAAIAGGVAAAVPKTKETESETTSGVKMDDKNTLEQVSEGIQVLGLADLSRLVAGGGEVGVANKASNEFADLLKGYSNKDLTPTGEDQARAQTLASNLFRPQQVGLEQTFESQLQQANQQAALMGRDVNDPILRAKLAQEQSRQQALLTAQQGAYGIQYAENAPRERMQRELSLMGNRQELLQGLAANALRNREALVSMGSQIGATEFNKRLSTAERWQKTKGKETTGGSPGEIASGAIAGGVQGFASGLSMGSSFGSMGGGGGGGGFNFGGGGMSAPSSFSGMNYGQAPSNFFNVQSAPQLMQSFGGSSGGGWGFN